MCVRVRVCVFRTVCTVPLIDYIDGNEYTMEPQQGGDEDGLARGAWDWSLLWKRVPLSQREKAQRKHTTQPYRYTHMLAVASMLTFIPVLFVSPSPISSPPTCFPSRCPTPHLMSAWCHRHCHPLCLSPPFPACAPPLHPPPSVYCVPTAPPPLCQNGVYGASNRLHQWPEVHHRAPGRRRRERLR